MRINRQNRFFRRASRAAVGALVFGCFAVGGHDANAAPWTAPSFLGSMEKRSSNIAPFTKWTAALDRYAAENSALAGQSCNSDNATKCAYDAWWRFLAGLRDKSRRHQLVAVNRYMNAREYVSDRRNWGISDYWATPGEFLTGNGDCEDYAIAKFMSLKALGWRNEDLRVVAVKDHNRGAGHAVVVAYHGGETWLLDNQIEDVVATGQIRHYEVVYSINEHNWWRHHAKETWHAANGPERSASATN